MLHHRISGTDKPAPAAPHARKRSDNAVDARRGDLESFAEIDHRKRITESEPLNHTTHARRAELYADARRGKWDADPHWHKGLRTGRPMTTIGH